jgi:hypothetical protein
MEKGVKIDQSANGAPLNLAVKTGKALNLSCNGESNKTLKDYSGKGLMNNKVDKGSF